MDTVTNIIAAELSVHERQTKAAVELLDGGATVPFIARYRKEVTGGLDDTQLRHLAERLTYLRDLAERRQVILKSIGDQGKLTAELEKAIQAAPTKTLLEDLYLPYKPKRRTKAQTAREAGLEPLAQTLLAEPTRDPEELARTFINNDKGITDPQLALAGARHILMETFGEDALLLGELREFLLDSGEIHARVQAGKEEEGAKFSDYFDYREPLHRIPSHRALALFRGRNEGVINFGLELDRDDKPTAPGPNQQRCQHKIARRFGVAQEGRPADTWLLETVRQAWRMKIFTRLEVDQFVRLKESAEAEAIRVFAANLRDLLLAAPAGHHRIIGLDPGLRTGVKVAVVDETGKLLDTATIYPHQPRNDWEKSLAILAALTQKHQATLVSIGNGTASRETDRLVMELTKRIPGNKLSKLVVSEAGASVYSASELAAHEFPDLDVTLRGAVSIARRLQDPLAELVKIDPKSIGVGQYQHDVNQNRLANSLAAVVEDCVNAVGVDVNTASAPLLTHVSGLNAGLAENIVSYRQENGAFKNRKTILKVPRLGKKAFEQAAGFLRIPSGDNPLDASAVHPEAYPVVNRILAATDRGITQVIGDKDFLGTVDPASYTDDKFGLPTIQDILTELEKPGRDPRPEFKTATFSEGVEELKDLTPGMILEGVVTNVTNFGAFVDVGVHQDGLVHISAMSEKFINDPREVVKAGDVVKVKVIEVDLNRRRVALTMRLQDNPEAAPAQRGKAPTDRRPPCRRPAPPKREEAPGAMADLFGNLKKKFDK